MAHVQKSLLDFIDVPCAMIIAIDGVQRDPPIHLTKEDLESFLWRNRDEWDRITLHYLDGLGMPLPDGKVELDRTDVPDSNHFML